MNCILYTCIIISVLNAIVTAIDLIIRYSNKRKSKTTVSPIVKSNEKPMYLTAKEHIELLSDEFKEEKQKLLTNITEEKLYTRHPSLIHAIANAFRWTESPEGYKYWQEFFQKIS